MAKRVRIESSKEDSKCRDQHSSIDRISMLSDELLVFILSLLTLKEATATSLLSRRWRYLWTFLPKLDFDGTESLLKVMTEERKPELALDKERWNYVKWVNNGIALHDSTIEELRVVFNLTKIYQECIDKWLRCALSRKVQRLELNFTDNGSWRSRDYDECYTFPYKLLRTDEGSFSNHSQSWSRQCNSIDFKYLKTISMHYVNVNGEALRFFLCNCPLLEHLSVSQSGDLSTLKITGTFPSFKRLEICFCHNLNSVEIRDANLVYFKYIGSRIHFLLENVPLLVEICIGGTLTIRMEDVLLMLWSYLPQLEVFKIDMCKFSWEETEMFYSAVEMSNRKQLVVRVDVLYDDSLLQLTNLIRASPCLQRFVLEASHCKPEIDKRKVEKIVRSYPHLKEVEFVGYRGSTGELELVMHLLENAVALEKILVDPRELGSPLDYHFCYRYCEVFKDRVIKDEMNARTRAKQQLTQKVSPKINLKIL